MMSCERSEKGFDFRLVNKVQRIEFCSHNIRHVRQDALFVADSKKNFNIHESKF